MFLSEKKNIISALLLAVSLWGCIGLTPRSDGDWIGYNYRGPFEGRVVDADTRKPMEGVVVFVNWMERTFAASRFYDTREVLTDSDGYFYVPRKWSWNPWTNIGLDASVVIYKAGYGHVWDTNWPDLKELAQYIKNRSSEKRKQLGPEGYFNIRFEGDLPIFLLKKLTTEKERWENLPDTGGSVPHDKKVLIVQEKNKERRSLGLKEGTE